jgi:hypothetical protein
MREEACWLRHLRDLAQTWVLANLDRLYRPPTASYVDLIFAFGLARLGARAESYELLEQARAVLLASEDEAHTFLLQAFEYRIAEARDGKPHTGPLSAKLVGELEHMLPLFRYTVNRFRMDSRILEPDERIDCYRGVAYDVGDLSDLGQALVNLATLSDPKEIAARVSTLFENPPRGRRYEPTYEMVLGTALELAPRVNEKFAKEMLDRALQVCRASAEPEVGELWDQAGLLEKAAFTAAHFGLADYIHPLVDRFQTILQAHREPQAIQAVEALADQYFRSLRKLGMRDEIDRLLTRFVDFVLGGKDLDTLVNGINFKTDSPAPLTALLRVAGAWLDSGQASQAHPVIEAAWALLLKAGFPPLKQTALACAYSATVGRMPTPAARERFEALFRDLKGVRDVYSTGTHFSSSMLRVIEAVVLAVVERWRS